MMMLKDKGVKKGFLLIECMIYCALLAGLMCASMQLVMQIHAVSKYAGIYATRVSQIETALDVFVRDIAQALPEAEHWSESAHELSFYSNPHTQIAWSKEDTHLMRTSQKSTQTKAQRKGCMKSVAIDQCIAMQMTTHKNGEGLMQSVTIECTALIAGNEYRTQRTAYLYNRTLA